MFEQSMDLKSLIEKQASDDHWGPYAQRYIHRCLLVVEIYNSLQAIICMFISIFSLLNGRFRTPRSGKNNDKAHPPIHPTRHSSELKGDEKRVYEFITRHFLACCSDDARGEQLQVEMTMGQEIFECSGTILLAK